ncbi:MAG: hypothetical protein K9G72_20130 [Rhodobacteraceae bacterium]|nr:hypothetical protein [Paracoccaceae bacterium]
MRAGLSKGILFIIAFSCATPVVAQSVPLNMAVDAGAIEAPGQTSQAIFAAQAVKTLEAVAAMHTRLAEIVPMQPRTDAIAQSAAAFTAHWGEVVTQYSGSQVQLIDSLIVGVNVQHQAQISDFLTADRLMPELSLFADPVFINPLEMPINFSNPPLVDAGFFGS